MSKGKHTPGPWEAEPMEDGCSVSYRINDTYGYEIGVTSGRDSAGEEEANAHLIAASPTLYEFVAKKASEGDVYAARIIASI